MTRRYECTRRSLAELYIALAGCVLVTAVSAWGFGGILSAAFMYGFSWWHPLFLATPLVFMALCLWGGWVLMRAPVEIALFDDGTVLFKSLVKRWQRSAREIRAVTRVYRIPMLIEIACGPVTIVVVSGTIHNFDFFINELRALDRTIEIRV